MVTDLNKLSMLHFGLSSWCCATSICLLFFDELVQFAQELNEEERRHLKEELSEEELAIFDLLLKPAPEMTEKERKEVKTVARDLMENLKKEKLVLDWRKKEMTRAAVRQSIEIILDGLPPAYDKEIYDRKCDGVYQHVYDSYWGSGQSVYAQPFQ